MHPYLHPMTSARPSRRKLIMLAIFAVFLMPLVARAALYAAGKLAPTLAVEEIAQLLGV